jgi:hypothetical protein
MQIFLCKENKKQTIHTKSSKLVPIKMNLNKFKSDNISVVTTLIISLILAISLLPEINSQKIVKQTTSNPFINQYGNTLLTLNKLYKVNKSIQPEKDGFNYLNSGYYISNQEEFNIKQSNRFQFDSSQYPSSCTMDRIKLISRINSIRKKHQVNTLEWDYNLEAQARNVAIKMKETKECEYENSDKNYFSELFSSTMSRLTESQVIEGWYETAYHYDFKLKKFKLNGINAEPMINLLWDETKKVGCGRVCCLGRELWVCDFFPVVIQPTLEEIGQHIKENKYLK